MIWAPAFAGVIGIFESGSIQDQYASARQDALFHQQGLQFAGLEHLAQDV